MWLLVSDWLATPALQKHWFGSDPLLYLGEVEEDLDGEGDDIHAGDAAIAAANEGKDDLCCAALDQTLTALRGQASGRLCRARHTHKNTLFSCCCCCCWTCHCANDDESWEVPYQGFLRPPRCRRSAYTEGGIPGQTPSCCPACPPLGRGQRPCAGAAWRPPPWGRRSACGSDVLSTVPKEGVK